MFDKVLFWGAGCRVGCRAALWPGAGCRVPGAEKMMPNLNWKMEILLASEPPPHPAAPRPKNRPPIAICPFDVNKCQIWRITLTN